MEVLLKVVKLIIPGGLWKLSKYLSHHFINVGDVGMAKDSKCSI